MNANNELRAQHLAQARTIARQASAVEGATNLHLAAEVIAVADEAERKNALEIALAEQRERERQLALAQQRENEEQRRKRTEEDRLRAERETVYRTEYAKLSELQRSTVALCEGAFWNMELKIDNLVRGCKIAWREIRNESDPDKRKYLEEDFRIKTNQSIDNADAELTKLLGAIGTRMQIPPYFQQKFQRAKQEQLGRLSRAASGIDVE